MSHRDGQILRSFEAATRRLQLLLLLLHQLPHAIEARSVCSSSRTGPDDNHNNGRLVDTRALPSSLSPRERIFDSFLAAALRVNAISIHSPLQFH